MSSNVSSLFNLSSLLSSPHSLLLPVRQRRKKKLNDDEDDADVIYRAWLRAKFDEFVRLLIDVVVSAQAEDALKEVVLDALMEFVKIANGGKFHSAIYHRLLHSIVHSTNSVDVALESLASKYFNYIDIRYFTYISLEKFATTLEGKGITERGSRDDENNSRPSMELCIRNMHYIISHIPPLEDLKENSTYEMWSGSGFSSKEGESKDLSELSKGGDKQHKSGKNKKSVISVDNKARKMKLKFTKAWISFLRLPLPLDVYKEVLVTLHQAVIPHLSNPIMLCDFLTRSYDIGGVVSVMALSSLFMLMTQHGLEYPNFYEKLHVLLLPSIFMAKHRAKFFELLDSCLKSPLLPAYLAAAFAKKLSSLALVVPPSGALIVIALIHNLLRRHPSINFLVHRDDGGESEAERENADKANNPGSGKDISTRKLGIDHFDDEESNPAKSNALRSSLWEVDTLRHHYCPPVSRFVLSLENDLTVRAKTTEIDIKDFSSGSYATIFGAEIRRRVKQVPLAVYKAAPTSLFSESDFTGWTFEYEGSKEKNGINGATIEENDHNNAKRQRIECS